MLIRTLKNVIMDLSLKKFGLANVEPARPVPQAL